MEHKDEKPQSIGLYDKIQVSVNTLDKVIISGIAAIILVLALGLSKRGYEITFDSMGGTSVQSQKLMYGDKVNIPGNPTREGYEFKGWYKDKECTVPWNMEKDIVTGKMQLYALWKAK